ncbi:MAG TPA: ABC transporter permease subunit, partial [Thermomicrobiales bacterium]
AGNLAFWLAGDRLAGDPLTTAAAGQSQKLVLATAGGAGKVLVATRDNTVMLVAGDQVAASAQLDKVVGAAAVSADGSRVYVGTSDGVVHVLDGALNEQNTFTVEGRVVGLAVSPSGGLFVGHGTGAFGERYFVSYFPTADGTAASTYQVGVPIGVLTAFGDAALYGTDDSRVGLIQAGAAAPAWETTLAHPITRVLGLPDQDRVLAGTKEGELSFLDGQGQLLWTTEIGPYPVRGLAFDPESATSFAGDSRGNLAAVGANGALQHTEPVVDSDLEAILPAAGGDFLIVPRDGSWLTLHPDALDATRLAGRLRTGWIAFDAALVLAAIVAAVVAVERWRLKARRQLRDANRGRVAYLLLLPAIALILAFSYYPAGLAFYYSLTNYSLRNVTEFVGLDNYRAVLFHDRYFRTGITNMIILVGTSVLKTITLPLLVAELVFWLKNSVHQYVFRTLFVLPAVVPDLVFVLMWRQVYDPNTGLLNQLLASTGLSRFQHAWLGEDRTAIWAIVGVGFPFVSAFAFLIFLGGLLNINGEYFDAAKVDGARWWQRLMHLDLPLLLPQFRILLFFAIVGTVQGFASIFILTRGGPGTATYVPALQMYLRIADGDFGYASAIGVVLFVVIMILTVFVLRFRRNEAVETT